MQALIELLAGFIALLVAAALSQFGVDIDRPARNQTEVRRVSDCNPPKDPPAVTSRRHDRC